MYQYFSISYIQNKNFFPANQAETLSKLKLKQSNAICCLCVDLKEHFGKEKKDFFIALRFLVSFFLSWQLNVNGRRESNSQFLFCSCKDSFLSFCVSTPTGDKSTWEFSL